jgi:hypothetical protein
MKTFFQILIFLVSLWVTTACRSANSNGSPGLKNSAAVSTAKGETLEEAQAAIEAIEKTPVFTPCNDAKESFVNYLNKYKDPFYAESLPAYKRALEFKVHQETGKYIVRVPAYQNFIFWSRKVGEQPWTHPDFQARQEVAVEGIKEELPKVRRMDLRRYYVTMLYRALILKPAMAKDPLTERTCQYFEASLEDGDDADLAKKFDIFLRKSKVTAKQIGFDPGFQSAVDLEATEQTLGFIRLAYEELKKTQAL